MDVRPSRCLPRRQVPPVVNVAQEWLDQESRNDDSAEDRVDIVVQLCAGNESAKCRLGEKCSISNVPCLGSFLYVFLLPDPQS